MRVTPAILLLTLVVTPAAFGSSSAVAKRKSYRSHPPIRRLPVAVNRPMAKGPARFVDAAKGDDRHDGSKKTPWKSINHAINQLQPAMTLYLRGGIYYESVRMTRSGLVNRPITIRSHPGEIAIIDGGYREFFERPAKAWEPFADGAEDEFRSTKPYPRGGGFGNFGDSMVPFQRYLTFHDLRSKNELWHKGLSNRADDPVGIYAGPGIRRDAKTGRIHLRLTHTRLAGLGSKHYRGETDPRKLPLVIAASDYALETAGAKHVRFQDLVVRGANRSAVRVSDSQHIEFDNVTLYGSGSALRTRGAKGLRVVNSCLRGHAAPWHSRSHHKDRAGAGYLLVADGRDFEFAYCEFTDHHDAVLLQNADDVKFHHNFVDHFNDDGIELGPKKKAGKTLVYQNRITRCLNTFTLHGQPKPVESDAGSGSYIFRNIVDLRRGVYKAPPTQPDPAGSYLRRIGQVAGDHGSPTWPILHVYHNTFILPRNTWRDYYAFGWGSHMRDTTRRVFNNIFVQVDGLPGLNFHAISATDDFHCDGNLLWGVRDGGSYDGDFFAEFRQSQKFRASQKIHRAGWGAHDLFAAPKFVRFDVNPPVVADVRLRPDSPAVDAGSRIPSNWPDPLRERDRGKSDIGALPLGVGPLKVGPLAH